METNAIVDSAPWFWLTPAASRPSKPPPVSGSNIATPTSFSPSNHRGARSERLEPGIVVRDGERAGARVRERPRLDGLLIERRTRVAGAAARGRREAEVIAQRLVGDQPPQEPQALVHGGVVADRAAAGDQRLGQQRVPVREPGLRPRPGLVVRAARQRGEPVAARATARTRSRRRRRRARPRRPPRARSRADAPSGTATRARTAGGPRGRRAATASWPRRRRCRRSLGRRHHRRTGRPSIAGRTPCAAGTGRRRRAPATRNASHRSASSSAAASSDRTATARPRPASSVQ